MQDEILKHSKKIYRSTKNQKHTFGEKAKEIVVEILIIVFAVTLSIWLHGWSEHRHEQKVAKNFLLGLRDDLKKDIEILEINKQELLELKSDYEFLKNINKTQSDTIIGAHTNYRLNSTVFNVGRYEGFKSSGKIETIEHNTLKTNILSYYQQTLPNLIFAINYLNTLQLAGIGDLQNFTDDNSLYTLFSTRKAKSDIHNIIVNSNNNILTTENAIEKVNEIIAEIDKEIGK